MSNIVESQAAAAAGELPADGYRSRTVRFVAFSWGFCAFFPVGLMYLHLLLMVLALLLSPDRSSRLRQLQNHPLLAPLLLMLAWTLLAAAVGGMFPDLPTRLFHVVRVATVLALALMLSRNEAWLAIVGLLVGAVFASAIIAVHQVWGLPEWAIWKSLIQPRNNFSSGNMVTLAVASGVLVCLFLRAGASVSERLLTLIAVFALGTTVVLHAVSRNAQALLALTPIVIILHRFRSFRASLSGLVVVLLLVTIAWQVSPTMERRFAEVTSNLHNVTAQSRYNSSIGVRWRMYQEAFDGMVERPVFGQGVGSWSPHWNSVWGTLDQKLSIEESSRFAEINNPHNDFLLAGMETGVPGILIVVWLFARIVRLGWRQRNTAGNITVMMAAAVAASAMVNAPLRDAALGMTLLWLLGASVAAHQETRPG